MNHHIPHLDENAVRLTWYVVGVVGIIVSVLGLHSRNPKIAEASTSHFAVLIQTG